MDCFLWLNLLLIEGSVSSIVVVGTVFSAWVVVSSLPPESKDFNKKELNMKK